MYCYDWNLKKKSIFGRYWCYVTVGPYIGRRTVLLAESVYGYKNAVKAIRQALQRNMDLNSVWTVSEGGNSPVSNNWMMKPEVFPGLKTPKDRKNEWNP
jgi:hypothetical protein